MSSVTVKAAAVAAFLIAGVGSSAAIAASFAIGERVDVFSDTVWVAIALVAAGVATSISAWRLTAGPRDSRIHALVRLGDVLPGGSIALLSLLATMSQDWATSSMALLFIPPLTGWMIARAARVAAESVAVAVRSAATGIVTVSALTGLLLAGQVVFQGLDHGTRSAGAWAFGYSVLATAILVIGKATGRRGEDPRTSATSAHMNTSSVMSMDNLTVSFRDRVILQGVSLTVDAGQLLAVVGSNGAGKSTLLRAAAGALSPSGGSVYLSGTDVTGLTTEERMRMGVAFVSGAHPVFPDLSVLENLKVAAHHKHYRRRSFAGATEQIIGLVPQLQGRLGSKAGVLSGGEQRMLALAQTLYQRPAVLLVDELTMGLDQGARTLVLNLLRHLADEGLAVVVVDHDLSALLARADAAAAIISGRLEIHTPPARALELHRQLIPAEFLAGASR